MMNFISVVVPVYNSGGLIQKCLTSLSEQDYPDFEVIIVNNGSDDDTEIYIDSFVLRDVKFKKINNGSNKGLGISLKIGFDAAISDYVIILHHDDFLPPNYLTVMGNSIRNGDVLLFTSYYLTNKECQVISLPGVKDYLKYFIPQLYLCVSSISTIGIMVKRQEALVSNVFVLNSHVIGEGDKTIKTYDEWRTWVNLSEKGNVRYVSQVRSYYRNHGNNMRDQMISIGDFTHRNRETKTRKIARRILKEKYGIILYVVVFTPLLYIYDVILKSRLLK